MKKVLTGLATLTALALPNSAESLFLGPCTVEVEYFAEVYQPAPEVTVKRGDNLWEIAKTFYGHGIKYTEIVKRNPEIKDPNLIYPRQEFKVGDEVTQETFLGASINHQGICPLIENGYMKFKRVKRVGPYEVYKLKDKLRRCRDQSCIDSYF